MSEKPQKDTIKVVALAGGVGGARLADGLAQVTPSENLTIVVNIGDDFEHFGLYICPDLDTVCYTLAGLANPETGWGRMDETWQAFQVIERLGGPTWFHLGDGDLGLHLERTRRLRLGEPLSQITRDFCHLLGVRPKVLPASDDRVPTWVCTREEGRLPFQEYFVHRQCQPCVTGFQFEGVEQAAPAPGVLHALREADLAIICPSNPWVSIDPILSIPGIRPALIDLPVLAVSPIIRGRAVKGPAAKMYAELGIQPCAVSVARHYRDLLTGFVYDIRDADQAGEIHELGILTMHTDTLMKTPQDRARLAQEVMEFAYYLLYQ